MTDTSFELYGCTINAFGLVAPLLFSLFIGRTYSRPYFRDWTLSYLFLAISMVVGIVVGPQTVTGALGLAVMVPYQIGHWYLLRTAENVSTVPRRAHITRGLWVVTFAAGLVGWALGQPLTTAMVGPVLFVIWVHLYLSRALWRSLLTSSRYVSRWLAVLVALTGLWLLSFPFLAHTPSSWLGYFVSGALHLLVGVQMVIYLLSDVAKTLEVQNEALQQVDRLKTNFISTVSHELRTPVTAIKSAAFLLNSPKVSPVELQGIIHQQTDALSRIVSDMLDVSLIESGAMTYQHASIDLVELVDEALSGITHLFEDKGITLGFEPNVDHLTAVADADRLKQVIANLLTNALKFTPEGGRVTVRVAQEHGLARIEVTDTGPGVPAGLEHKIFERFYQVDNSATRKVGGAGLGLAISRAIVEDGHSGRIWVDSTAERGSTFFMTLPIALAAKEAS